MKRVISMLLVCCMLFGCLPMFAAAEETNGKKVIIDKEYDPKEQIEIRNALINAEDSNVDKDTLIIASEALQASGREVREVEPNNAPSLADRINNEDIVSGIVSAGSDIDFFKFTLSARTQVTIAAVSTRRSLLFGIWDSYDDIVAISTYMKYENSYYQHAIVKTLPAGTYYIGVTDENELSNIYTFICGWEEQTAHTHSYVATYTQEATCQEGGYTIMTCSCGNSYTEYTDPLDHVYNDVITQPTCKDQGYTTHTCVNCGYNYKDTYVSATGNHTYDDHKDTDCNVCGQTRTVVPGVIPVYRLYNPFTHEHLLTGGEQEKNALLAAGWSLDGLAWYAPETGIPVYRLYNPYDDWHTYTTDVAERDAMIAAGWTLDGAVSCSAPATGRPIYRLYNPYVKTNFHMFTASIEERDTLVNAGWKLEGVAWYALN